MLCDKLYVRCCLQRQQLTIATRERRDGVARTIPIHVRTSVPVAAAEGYAVSSRPTMFGAITLMAIIIANFICQLYTPGTISVLPDPAGTTACYTIRINGNEENMTSWINHASDGFDKLRVFQLKHSLNNFNQYS
jgi:hypothetical protein